MTNNIKKIKSNKFISIIAISLILFAVVLLSGCTKCDCPTPVNVCIQNTTNNTQNVNVPSEVQTPPPGPRDKCVMENSNIGCSDFSLTRNKINVTFVNKNVSKLTVVDFRAKSDGADIVCTGNQTIKTFINANSEGKFALVCGGIPTGRLPYEERAEIYFEIDYKVGSSNTLQTATGRLDAKVN